MASATSWPSATTTSWSWSAHPSSPTTPGRPGSTWSTCGATDILSRDSLTDPSARPVRPVRKTLVTDLSDVPGLHRVDDIEGITLGPRLPEGRRTVVLVSDDNFDARLEGLGPLHLRLPDRRRNLRLAGDRPVHR
ncbi:esterase-like activity of phytase family protein [Streptomyces sp. VNUA24]|uniref:esterase-like activity of phytase family protein n=1 Tax=Streptomyces sp. VNUA24 TaxID=3031131 RepID=UPI0031B9B5A9